MAEFIFGLALYIVTLILGGVVGLFIGVYFEESLTSWKARWTRSRRVRAVRRGIGGADGAVWIGGRQTRVHLVEGDGGAVLEPPHVTINVESSPANLRPLVQAERESAQRSITDRQLTAAGATSWNSDALVRLIRYRIIRTPTAEEPAMNLDVAKSDYATFVATILSLGEDKEITTPAGQTTLRREFRLDEPENEDKAVMQPIAELSHGLGLVLLAITEDNKALLARRRSTSRARPDERDASVVEGMHIEKDATEPARLSVYQTAVRGCREELGVDVAHSDVCILGFGVDLRYYQWNFVGLVKLRYTAQEALSRHALHARDRWEGRIEPLQLDPVLIFQRLRTDGIWDMGLVAIYLALCRQLGAERVQKAALKVFV